MTTRELVLNFVNQYNKPFDAELIANMTGLDIDDVEPVMVEMIKDKTIKLISDRTHLCPQQSLQHQSG